MPSSGAVPPPHRRTVAEAIAQADAKERIRTALGVRYAGVAMVVGGISWAARHSWLRPDVAIHIHGGPTFTFSFMNLAGIGSIILGPFVYLVGQWMLKRATAAARSDPVTAAIFDQPMP